MRSVVSFASQNVVQQVHVAGNVRRVSGMRCVLSFVVLVWMQMPFWLERDTRIGGNCCLRLLQ